MVQSKVKNGMKSEKRKSRKTNIGLATLFTGPAIISGSPSGRERATGKGKGRKTQK